MSASLVGSEMCIRDRPSVGRELHGGRFAGTLQVDKTAAADPNEPRVALCLLYTSDAADDM
eukprot:5686806-Alexandrium_andersonii.AAC.1